jgi:hypothetical protein
MKQFMRQLTAIAGAILIALGLIGINADQDIAQAKARKGAKVRLGDAPSIISPRDSASGLPTGIRIDRTRRTPFLSSKNEVSIETIERGRLSNGNMFMPEIGDEALVYNAKLPSAGNSKTYQSMSDADTVAGAKRRKARNGNGGASFDIRRPKE